MVLLQDRRGPQAGFAMEAAPDSFPLLTPEEIAEGAEIHAQSRFPEEYEDLVQTRAAGENTETNILRALNELDPPPPSVEELIDAA